MRLTPRTSPAQTLRESRNSRSCSPNRSFSNSRKDYFGNDVTTFAVFRNHDHFAVHRQQSGRSRAEAGRKRLPSILLGSRRDESLDTIRRWPALSLTSSFSIRRMSRRGPNWPNMRGPPSLPAGPWWTRFTSFRTASTHEFRYEPKSTSIEMPLLDVLDNRRGVCQDFCAHHDRRAALPAFGRAVRQRLPAQRREFSRRRSIPRLGIGFRPALGWLDFDPTNDVRPSDGHITLAWGRDYGDVTPVKGITLGGGGQIVNIEVFVKPCNQPIAT